MAYVKQTWTDGSGGGTPVSAARLAVIEDGIEATAIVADAGAADATTALANAATAQGDATTALADAATAQVTADAGLPEATATAKGDLLVAQASADVIRVAVGTDGRALEADSSAPAGVAWGRLVTVAATAPAGPTTGDLWLKPKV